MSARFRKQFVKSYQGMPGSHNDEPSMTVPDQHLTVKQLLINHARGINSAIKNYDPQYFDTEIPVIEDIVDLMEYKEELAARQKEIDAEIKRQKDAKLAEIRKAKEKDSVEDNRPPQKKKQLPGSEPGLQPVEGVGE